jgi:hypothetical protein
VRKASQQNRGVVTKAYSDPKRPTGIACAVAVAVALIFGLIDGYIALHGMRNQRPLDLAASITVVAICYLWYRSDSDARQYRGSVFLGGAIIIFTALAVPIYLAISRERGRKLKAVLSYLGLLLLLYAVYATASVASQYLAIHLPGRP